MTAELELRRATQSAAYLGVTCQAIHLLTRRPYLDLGTWYGAVWMFTRAEPDGWPMRPHLHRGRLPGSNIAATIPSSAIAAR